MFKEEKEWNWAGIIIGLIILCTLQPVLIMFLWNWLMPLLFGLATIGFWEALGLGWLCSLLFKTTSYIKER